MKKTSRRILFFGNEKLATGIKTQATVFKGLIDAGYQIEALILSQKLNKNADDLEVVKLAKINKITIKSFSNLKQSVEEIKKFNVDTAVLAAYGKIIPPEIISIFRLGIINIHPSLLPRHRGPIPIESVILNGDSETGVSIMRLAADMDAGPIYAQRKIKLQGDETKQELADKLDQLGRDLLINSLEDIMDGKLKPKEQSSEGTTYDSLINKEDGFLSWHEKWEDIERKIRAYSGWPTSKFTIDGASATLLEASFEAMTGRMGTYIEHNGYLSCYCKDGLVVIERLIPAGSRAMSGKDYLMGYGKSILS